MTFLSQVLEQYGLPHLRYEGKGELANEKMVAIVEWAVAQYDDGQVLLACQGDESTIAVFFAGPRSFRGESAEGITFTYDKEMGELPFLGNPPDVETGGWAVYRLSMLHLDFPASGPPGLVRYLLTNFEFDFPPHRPLIVRLPGVYGEIRLAPELTDPLTPVRLRTLRNARPTAWLEINPQRGQAVAAREVANELCSLLSIARGTKISWIQEEIVSTDGTRTHLILSNRVTKPFTPFAPIDPVRIRRTQEFLEGAYPTFRERRDRYKLDRGTIDSVLDAKIEGDFLETRGAKLAVALETLKNNVLVVSNPDVEHYAPLDAFTRSLDAMTDCVRKVLKENGVMKDVADAMATPLRLRSLNRRSFGSLLRMTCKEIDLQIQPSDLQLFVSCRNSLVHRGAFYCETASPEEREEAPPKATKFDEYLFLIAVVDAFLLRLVDYRGPYLVRTGGSVWEERRV